MSPADVRALTVFHVAGVGGPQRSLPEVMTWLRSRGGVEFIVPASGPTEVEYRPLGPVTVLDYTTLTYARRIGEGARLARLLARDVRTFRAELRNRRPDLVVAVTTVLPAVVVAARLERIPTVVYAAELYGQEWKAAPALRVWGGLLAIATAALSQGVVCCSRAVARQFPSLGRKPLLVAYPPVGSEYASGSRAEARARFGLSDDDRCIAVVGSISRGRGQDVALRALDLLRPRFGRARLLVVGDPHPRPVDLAFADELRELTRALGLDDAVTFAGAAETGFGAGAMAEVYAAADVVVNPARFAESFGRVAPEALMAGRPVVATSTGAIPEVLRDGVDGLLVPPDDPKRLAEAVGRLLDEPVLAERLVANGRRRVIDEFGHEQNMAAWMSAIDRVLAHRGQATAR